MNPVDTKRRALGRGLDALIPSSAPPPPSGTATLRDVFYCAIEKISPQKGQPRQHFDQAALEDLAASIREHGLLEPIVVRRPAPGVDRFEIIAGERRWRASQKAGLHEVLVVVKDVSTREVFELALIENIQREDLNPVELAEALDRLVREHAYTQETLAERLGKDRTTIANCLRLLKLPPSVRSKVIGGELSEGHARALLGVTDPIEMERLAERIAAGKLSVRATEELVRGAKKTKNGSANGRTEPGKSAAIRDLEQRLTRSLGTKVVVRDQGNQGEIAIPYVDLDMLDRILNKLL